MSVEFNNLMVSDSANKLEVAELSELIENRLYFMVLSNHKGPTTLQTFKDWKNSLKDNNIFYLNVDDNLVYDGFYSDFGPLNLAMIYRYIGIVRDKLKVFKKVVHCAHIGDQKKRSNAAFLICTYLIIENNWTAHQTYNILSQQYKYKYLPFRDASCLLQSEYSVSVEECVNALYKAKWYGFFDMSDFDLDEYEKYETVKYGDINWIVPATLLAFSSPHTRDYIDKSGYQIHSPAYYYPYFKENNVKHVVRLNSKKTYDAKRTFVAVANIQHTDLVFTDGTPPSDSILKYFLRLCEQYIDDNCDVELANEKSESNEISNTIINSEDAIAKCVGAVAVHCKAGLGRTGCLVASYIVKHWSFTAVEAIAWIRICRPGSVIGVQQQWLIDKEEYLTILGKQWRQRRKNAVDKYKRFINGIYSAKRHTSNANAYEYVDPPPHLNISNEKQFTSSSSGNSETCEESEEYKQRRLSSVLKSKLKTNNQALPNVQNDVYVPNLRQKRSASKNEDPKPKSTFSALKSIRRVTNASIGISMNSLVKKNNTTSTITITRSNLKASLVGKKNTKPITVCKSSTKSTRTHTSETATKITDETKPSYALATVASSARVSRRLRNQNCITK
ncbi:dual specificity protein phosphatase CDC14C-like [Rhopalosiphum padi]|uniref:dual specificity protein phosphatase CDC14C-like n=1 Tax=Rhopalosiphum padi TaxID=40932 RepID=UPI00298E0D0A|nr:dual specificity protein phosphatase CDC14C-like [Rhopalosiphum padi]XP_060844474.1 dual specificity protein phosphatase CDC14C-like [Rhopalosiphum padi]XP_060844475.1 dual specificity protein phosphatase CDC14C-like [Rhopalosiphum padi]XP_060844476.1 dual specificity protein phosphatase CDC14C-like [Rhopalosiphum padi]XP_060844478.1 dual specificity protein phosphatase CDC14C-like [Rhopalosiphum padi]XP_060844479.1 dual specificity protein phosphatase CDC14C-like [Rhopalosiphum padi]XP_06